MVVYRQKKRVKYRGKGSGTHGGGARKKRRGAGSRGGRGNAGTGKRAGHKKAGMKTRRLGQHGFTSIREVSSRFDTLNVGYFTSLKVRTLLQQGKAVQQGDQVVINLTELGYGKLLGTGSTTLKLKLIVNQWSAQAEEKIKAAGGSLEKKAA